LSFHVPEQFRIRKGPRATTEKIGNNGAFLVDVRTAKRIAPLRIIASDGKGWEHVSISLENKCPSWQDMCIIKNLFWDEEDCVIQYHPPRSEYVNNNEFCLHLWRKSGYEFPLPPSIMV